MNFRTSGRVSVSLIPGIAGLMFGSVETVQAQSSRNPASVPGLIRESNQPKEARLPFPGLDPLFSPWYDAKSYLSSEHGFNFSLAYTGLYQYSTDSMTGRDQASGGIYETLGTWAVLGRGTDYQGTLGYRVEGRQRLWNSIAPQSLSSEIGAGVPTGIGFGEFDLSLAELYWEQSFVKDRFSVRLGKMLPFGYFDFFPYKSPKTGFANAAFALNPSIAWPQFGLGVSTEIRPHEDIYILAGIHDANGTPTRSGFDTFFDDREYFKIMEVGWDPGYIQDGKKDPMAPDYHATIWHTDAREAAGRPEGWGAGVTATQPLNEHLMAFGRYGYSDGGAALLKHVVMGGVGLNGAFGWAQDSLGFAVGVGEPSASGLDTQFTAEIYNRMQITKRLSVTPSIQLIANPSSNPDTDTLAVFGLRGRVTF